MKWFVLIEFQKSIILNDLWRGFDEFGSVEILRVRVGCSSWVAGQEAVAGQWRIAGGAEPGQGVKMAGVAGQRLKDGARAGCGDWSCR